MDFRQVYFPVAMAFTVFHRAVAAPTRTTFFIPQCAHQPMDGKPDGCRHNEQCYDGL
jgi:hypothetical protein